MPEWTDDQVNEWSQEIKREKFERAARAGWGSEKEQLTVRLSDLEKEKAKVCERIAEVNARLKEIEEAAKE